MIKILAIGSYLSSKSGTKDIIEKNQKGFLKIGIEITAVSRFQNKYLRLCHILIAIIFSGHKIVKFSVFSGQAFLITQIGSFVAKSIGKKIIFNLHGGGLPEFTELNKGKVLMTFKRANIIISPSLYLIDYYKKQGIEVKYIPNSIEASKFPYYENPQYKHKVLWVRAFTEIYNPDIAVRALKIIRESIPDAKLTMVGPDKGNLKLLKHLIEELDLVGSIELTGPIKNEEIVKFYHSHDVFINTTGYESFGVAVLEAALCGIPIVSSKVGEIPIIWKDEKEILMTENLSEKEFARLILKLFDDGNLRNKLKKNARKRAEEFEWDRVKNTWIDLMNKINELS